MRNIAENRSGWSRRFQRLLVFVLAWQPGRAGWTQELKAPQPRQGYYFSGGLYGAATLSREREQWLGPWEGFAGMVRAGQRVTEHLGLGLAFEGGRTYGNGQTATATAFSLESSWFFGQHWTARAGVGVGFLHLHDPGRLNESTTRGPAGSWWSAGTSYERLLTSRSRSGGVSLGPSIQARVVAGNGATGMNVYLGVEGTFWTGLPPDQLASPAIGGLP